MRGPIKLGGMKEVIRKFDLTPEIQMVGLSDSQKWRLKQMRVKKVEELKAMGYGSDSASDISVTELIAELDKYEEPEEEKKEEGAAEVAGNGSPSSRMPPSPSSRTSPRRRSSPRNDKSMAGQDSEARGVGNLNSPKPAPPVGVGDGKSRSAR